MRYAVAICIGIAMVLSGIALAGAGHGRIWGAIGCFVLAPIAIYAWANALRPAPSARGASTALALGLAVSAVVAAATAYGEIEHLSGLLRVNPAAGPSVVAFAFFNWLAVSVWAIARSRRLSQHGT